MKPSPTRDRVLLIVVLAFLASATLAFTPDAFDALGAVLGLWS